MRNVYGSFTDFERSFTGHLRLIYGQTHVIYHLPPLYRGEVVNEGVIVNENDKGVIPCNALDAVPLASILERPSCRMEKSISLPTVSLAAGLRQKMRTFLRSDSRRHISQACPSSMTIQMATLYAAWMDAQTPMLNGIISPRAACSVTRPKGGLRAGYAESIIENGMSGQGRGPSRYEPLSTLLDPRQLQRHC